ncbi:quinolinate synthase NadA [Megalodesulfovibrio gigas]|uniref:quinolinate synthase n=1 Tax=Megalodesulfovibrio gigas (strain ATCC 19364 / DSM 1382 / NCIMB 9332 / VKM B-1759) TaxID=1121448 RepID=T2GCI1_MEGG1|nr:quinolinate synthase NadA [Megalodesulfovibrio gigas]AGW14008.1 putative quinolinate synthetase [Megalodesulfovibrio gigas DSM 1382 = ATCC 19364]
MTPTERILAIKAKLGRDLVILAHHYQEDAVVQHADQTGDSLELARAIPGTAAKYVVFCGVAFMAESAALLAPAGVQVFNPVPEAACVMAEMSPATYVEAVLQRLQHPESPVIPLAYVNTSVATKAVVGRFGGAVCTSANAATMLQWALAQADKAGQQGRVLFLPDQHLGHNTANKLGIPAEKRLRLDIRGRGERIDAQAALQARLLLWPGNCPVHAVRFKLSQIQQVRDQYPEAKIAVHPECAQEVVNAVDGAGSTSFLIKYAAEAPAGSRVYIGTECNLVDRLTRRHAAEKTILPLWRSGCSNMNKTTEARLADALEAMLEGRTAATTVDEADTAPARASLTRMLEACS